MATLLSVAALVFVVWFFFGRGKAAVKDIRLDETSVQSYVSDGSSVEEPDEIEIRRATEAQEEVFDRWLSKRDARDAANRDVRQKLTKANEIVEETSLDDALKQIWRGLDFLSVPEGQEPLWPLPEGFSGLKVESHRADEKTYHWTWNGKDYGLSKERSSFEDYDWVMLKLSVHAELVLALNFNADYGAMVETLEFRDVEALRVGPWMSDAIRMAGDLEHAVESILDESVDEMDREKAAQIDLGGQA